MSDVSAKGNRLLKPNGSRLISITQSLKRPGQAYLKIEHAK